MFATHSAPGGRFPLWTLMHPRQRTRSMLIAFGVGLIIAAGLVTVFRLPFWVGTVGVISVVTIPAAAKWRDDARRWGRPLMVLSVLLAAQTFHGIEHIVQWIEFHGLRWPAARSGGLISPANAEWVHFVWNWVVLLTIVYLMYSGMRNVWAWLLLAWALGHTFEHTYLMINYLQAVQLLNEQGVSTRIAQGLPGILGRNGWLAVNQNSDPTAQFICSFAPVLKQGNRIDVHFWWNVGETALLLPAAHRALRGKQKQQQQLINDQR